MKYVWAGPRWTKPEQFAHVYEYWCHNCGHGQEDPGAYRVYSATRCQPAEYESECAYCGSTDIGEHTRGDANPMKAIKRSMLCITT